MNHHRIHPRIAATFACCAGLVSSLLLAAHGSLPVASAGDDKIFAPHFCVPQLEPGNNELAGRIGNALIHPSTIMQVDVTDGYQTFICPLVRDIVTGDLDDVWVRLVNNHPDAPFPPDCCVYSVSLDSNQTDFECETADNDIHGSLSLRFELDGFTEFDFGHYAVVCELGLADQIISIRTSESD
jgi:hypothetical protein